MKANEKTTNYINSIDSSELSSDISEEEELGNPLENIHMSPIKTRDFSSDKNIPFNKKKVIKEKRARFYSEDDQNYFHNKKGKCNLKIKKINKNLKNMAKDELINSKTRKFTFS